MLKLPQWKILNETAHPAAFRRLCVETLITLPRRLVLNTQPPSGGCVLKRISNHSSIFYNYPAAFRRLCVETAAMQHGTDTEPAQPPSGGCVLKQKSMMLHR